MACRDISSVACVLSSALFFVLFLHHVFVCFVLCLAYNLNICMFMSISFGDIVKAEYSNGSISSNLGSLSESLRKKDFSAVCAVRGTKTIVCVRVSHCGCVLA